MYMYIELVNYLFVNFIVRIEKNIFRYIVIIVDKVIMV